MAMTLLSQIIIILCAIASIFSHAYHSLSLNPPFLPLSPLLYYPCNDALVTTLSSLLYLFVLPLLPQATGKGRKTTLCIKRASKYIDEVGWQVPQNHICSFFFISKLL